MTQVIINGLCAGSVWAVAALGIGLVLAVCRFFHFAHGAMLTLGAYIALTLASRVGIPLPLACVMAVGLAGAFGMVIELVAYGPVRVRSGQPLALLLVSLGVYVVLENGMSLVFGNEMRVLHAAPVREGILIAGGRISPAQMVNVCTSAVTIALVSLLITKTSVGVAIRAAGSDPLVASVVGISYDRVAVWTLGMASALAAVAGIMLALDVGMTPTMGMNALLMGMVATVIGGVGSVPGAALGGLLLGLAQHLGVWKIGAQWQDAIAFAVLLVFLLFRPYGIFGRKLRKAEI